ncbi:putative GPI anchored protein [Rosellinia necatrix]|uniref:Putative GPI anchored protein n=1 Tax=Rosellinia necatrix TaxID=77044 RepID=A0A1W2TK12_ROSNE|nr:putative GPI anchored protein [Rosellinia necatrix]
MAKSFALLIIAACSVPVMGGAVSHASRGVGKRATYNHPGLLHTADDFSRISAKVSAKAEPWYSGWEKLIAHASTRYTASPKETVWRGTGSPENYPSLYRDIAAAYANALVWKINGTTAFADTAAGILDAWSSTLTLIDGSSDKFLAAGLYGYQFANAAELLRDYENWDGLSAAIDVLENVFYPLNSNFLVNHNGAKIDHYWANWDLCNIASIQAIGVLSDNSTKFDEANDYFQNGEGNGALEKAIWITYNVSDPEDVLGQGQEAGRDQGHATLDFALLGVIGQQAYNQDVDLFGLLSNRILAGAEYVAAYNLNYTVPYTEYTNSDVTQSVISNGSRGNVRPTWELLYAHYAEVKNVSAPYTLEFRDWVVEKSGGAEGGGGDYGSTSGGYDQLGYGTLLFRRDE